MFINACLNMHANDKIDTIEIQRQINRIETHIAQHKNLRPRKPPTFVTCTVAMLRAT